MGSSLSHHLFSEIRIMQRVFLRPEEHTAALANQSAERLQTNAPAS